MAGMLAKRMIAADIDSDLREDGSAGAAPRNLLMKLVNLLLYYVEALLFLVFGWLRPARSVVLSGGFAPVEEEVFAGNLQVLEGAIPELLSGCFLRTGPNPYFTPRGGYHWFDGDGMVHAVRLRGGKASYNNRFVQTARLRQEKACGYEAFAKFGRLRGLRGLASISLDLLKKRLGVLDASHGLGTANTALAFHAGRLLALHEGDLPYQLRLACNGLVSTVRRVSFGGASRHSFTAHPKIDPETGELFAFGYQLDKAPFLHYLRCDATGAVAADFEVPLPSPVMMHDFAVTARHVIFVDAPLHFAPEAMVRRGTLPFVFDKAKAIRFGVLDRYAPDAAGIRWFEGPTGMIFHVANAWEAGEGRVELHACIMNDFSLDAFTAASGDAEPYLTRVCLDLRSGEATAERVSPLAGDFPVVPAALAGRRTRYAYVATLTTGGEGQPRFDGVAKIRLAAAGPGEAVAGRVLHGEGRVGGEAFFVPKEGGREEDDGYLMTIVYDEGAGRSELVIYDAASMAAAPVARVALPRRVPHGFHSTWVPQSQMDAQV